MTTYPIAAGGAVAAADATMVVNPVSGDAETANSTADSPIVTPAAKAVAVDTVTLQSKVQSQTRTARKDVLWGGNDKIGNRIGAVLFAYNSKGDLRIKFMDSANKLIYQTPPVMMARMMDLMLRSDSSVSARV